MPSLLGLAMGAAIRGLFAGAAKAIRALRALLSASRIPRMFAPFSRLASSGAIRSAMRTIGDGFDLLRGRPYAHFPPASSELVEEALFRCTRAGHRMPIASITAGELAELTRRTNGEWAVVAERGQLRLVRGAADHVPVRESEHVLVHTHPDNYGAYDTAVSEGNVGNAAGQGREGWDHPQAVVDRDGNVHAFDSAGVVEKPGMSPIHPDGNIDGMYSHPGGAPMRAVPPAMERGGGGS